MIHFKRNLRFDTNKNAITQWRQRATSDFTSTWISFVDSLSTTTHFLSLRHSLKPFSLFVKTETQKKLLRKKVEEKKCKKKKKTQITKTKAGMKEKLFWPGGFHINKPSQMQMIDRSIDLNSFLAFSPNAKSGNFQIQLEMDYGMLRFGFHRLWLKSRISWKCRYSLALSRNSEIIRQHMEIIRNYYVFLCPLL